MVEESLPAGCLPHPEQGDAARVAQLEGEIARLQEELRQSREEALAARVAQRLALEEQRERLRLSNEAAGIGVWNYEPDIDRLEWDDRCRAIYGQLAGAEISADGFLQLVHPEDRLRVQQELWLALESRTSYDCQYRVFWPDGSLHWVNARGRGQYAQDGSLIRVVGISLEITENRQLREQIRLGDARYRLLVENSYDGIWTVDASGRTDFINHRGAQMLGYNTEEVIGRAPEDFVYPGAETDALQNNNSQPAVPRAQDAGPGMRQSVEKRLRKKDGSPLWVNSSTLPLFGEDGASCGSLTVMTDITKRKQAEIDRDRLLEALAAEHARLAAVLIQLPVGVSIVEAPSGRLLMANEQVAKIWRKPATLENFTQGTEIFPTFHEDGSPYQINEWPLVRAALHGEVVINEEIDFLRGDGTRGVMLVSAAPVYERQRTGESDRIGAAVTVFFDITERKEMEAAMLDHKTRLEVQRRLFKHRERERTRIARDLHDGPIQSLIGLGFAIQSILNAMPETHVREMLIGMRLDVNNLVGELREVSNELRPPALARFGLEKAIRSHAAAYREKYPHVNLRLDLADDGLLLADDERLALFRVYQEALYNATRHAQATGITVRLSFEAQVACLEIEDNGCGFEIPAQLVDLAREGRFGLVGIQEHAEAAGGTAEVRSRPGGGTRVIVRVPLKAAASAGC